ncbi:hypothetical protein HD554DRAFT_2041834 [Boletus coccyginus]|nr:hypothetical protein HD554DRAFT_2041834 [Boletus coccyginus]
MPHVVKFIHPQGGTYTRCQVEVFFDDEDRDSAGYLPLPCRYSAAWIQLCYTIVYWLSTWKAWHAELQKKDAPVPQKLSRLCYNNSGMRLIKYLNIRRLIVEELLRHKMSKDDSDELDVFDEYLIRDRYDWLWTDIGDIPKEMQYILGLDPVHPLNDAIFSGELTEEHHSAWNNPKLSIPAQMVAPMPSLPTQGWLSGRIDHFDFQANFEAGFPELLRYSRNKAYRFADDLPYDHSRRKLPAKWHEGHEPAVVFQTEAWVQQQGTRTRLKTERRNVGWTVRSQSAELRSSEAASGRSSSDNPSEDALAGPLGAAKGRHGIIDNIQTCEIVQLLAQPEGGIGLSQALESLEKLLGNSFDAESWGTLLDSVHAEPGEAAAQTVDEVFAFYAQQDGARLTRKEHMANFRKATVNLLG